MLALLALAFVLGAALARRMVPEPWATVGVGLVGLSPPALGRLDDDHAGRAAPRSAGGRRAVRAGDARAPAAALRRLGALCLAGLPWLGWTFLAPGAVVAWALVAWTLRERGVRGAARRRGPGGVAGLLRDDQRPLLRRHHPRSAGSAAMPELPLGYIERVPRLPGLGWTATSACCAGRPCSGSSSSRAGCCTARGATNSRGSRRRREAEACAGCSWRSWARRCSWSRSWRPAGLRGRRSPACPLVGGVARGRGSGALGRSAARAATRGRRALAARSPWAECLALARAGRGRVALGLVGRATPRALGPCGSRVPFLHRGRPVARRCCAALLACMGGGCPCGWRERRAAGRVSAAGRPPHA